MGFDDFYGAHYSNDMYPYHFWRNRDIAVRAPLDQSRITEFLNAELFSFIERNAGEPFFAYYASPWPHHPLHCGQAFAGRSRGGVYGDCIEEFDDGIGRLLDLLDRKNLADRTLVVFTSDNGPWHQGSPGGHRGRKGNSFDGGQAVPTLCWGPGMIRSGPVEAPIMGIDFLPTFCEMAGIDLPRDREIDGRSLLPLLTGRTDQSPHDALFYLNPFVADNPAAAVRSRDHFKYHRPDASDNATFVSMRIHPFLFDLRHDRDESYDVRMQYPDVYADMKARLAAFNDEVRQARRGWR